MMTIYLGYLGYLEYLGECRQLAIRVSLAKAATYGNSVESANGKQLLHSSNLGTTVYQAI
jgi:hypothetical protein